LGAGFLEIVYQRALLAELGLRGIRATAEVSLTVTYKGYPVGEYVADILVEDVRRTEVRRSVGTRACVQACLAAPRAKNAATPR